MANNASSVLKIAAGEIGYSRWDDPNPGTKYGRWYAQDHGSYYGQSGVPYCAMFVSWVFDQAGAKCAGLPEAYCPYILNDAKSAGKVLADKADAKPGDVVLFDWDGGVVDHVGIVEKNCGSYIQTIEGNTSSGSSGSQGNGGGVYRRTRSWSVVKAVVRPSYYGSSGSTSSGSSSSASAKITVDGHIGPATVKAWQKQLGTSQDGVISGQSKSDKAAHERINAIKYGSGGSDMIFALQKFLKAKGYSCTADRYLGKKTVTALQKWMRDKLGYKAHAIDGICGPNTAANVQNAINRGAFK